MMAGDEPQERWRRIARIGLDLFERFAVLALFALMASRIFGSVSLGASPFNILVLVSEGLVVALVIARRPASELSLKPMDWILAFGASALPTLLRPGHTDPLVPTAVAGALMLFGLAFQVICKLALMRSFGVAPANRGLIIRGPYRLVRHPIYASYLFSQAGFLLLNPTAWNLAVLSATCVLQIFRIDAEERLLAHDPGHATFCRSVRYRLIPGIY
jgi:protein-S-isoprenylcysteine O-methyltransferase Ste14